MSPRIEKLQQSHDVGAFDCGNEPLNRFLKKFALRNQSSGSSTTYLGLVDQTVIGYYSIASGSVEYEKASLRMRQGEGRYPIPVALIARLAVDKRWQRKGVGKGLLKDAMLMILGIADKFGIRAVLVNAKDIETKKFYDCFDFESSPTDPLQLMVLLKDVRHRLQYTQQQPLPSQFKFEN